MPTFIESFYIGRLHQEEDLGFHGLACERIKNIDDKDPAAYRNNVNPGTATITVSGKEACIGKKEITFNIERTL
jgi:hypothetical protein